MHIYSKGDDEDGGAVPVQAILNRTESLRLVQAGGGALIMPITSEPEPERAMLLRK